MNKLTALATAALAGTLTLVASPARSVVVIDPGHGTYSQASVYFGNRVTESSTNIWNDASASSSVGEVSATGDYERSFSGLNTEGDDDTSQYDGAAAALAEYGNLKAEARYSLVNALANEANPVFVDADFNIDEENGVPDTYGAFAMAFFRDSLAVNADPSASYLQLSLRLTGDILSEGLAWSTAIVRQNDGGGVFSGGFNTLAYVWADGPHDQMVVSNPIPIVDGFASFGLMLEAEASVQLSPEMVELIGRDSAGNADFFSTLGVLEVAAFAADDRQVALAGVTSGSGFQYPISAIPEPSMAWMLLAGLLVLAAPRLGRRR